MLGAYQYLLDYHLNWYVEHPTKQARREVYQGRGGEWFLTTEEKKRILLNNLYGVDIDPQAVEVTKLSLLLKVLEGESQETIAQQRRLWEERALPDLANNIKCGNSLIGYDFLEQMPLLDEEHYRINPFDWQSEFPQVFAASRRGEEAGNVGQAPSPSTLGEGRGEGGFDVVIGNPPYIRIQTMKEWAPREVELYKEHYRAASKGNYDIYVVFAEKGLSLLNAHGRLGFILPHKFFNAQYGAPLRQLISGGKHLAEVVHFGDQQVFENATTYTCLLFLDKAGREACNVQKVSDLPAWLAHREAVAGIVPAARITESEWNFAIGSGADLFQRLSEMPVKLGDVADVFVGTQTSADDVFVLDDCRLEGEYVVGMSKALGGTVKVEADCVKPFLRGKDIRRYEPIAATAQLICPYEITSENCRLLTATEMMDNFPLAMAHLMRNKAALSMREKGKFKGNNWYAFGYPKSMTLFQKPKIVVPDYNNVASFTFDDKGHFYKTGYGVISKENHLLSTFYILGLINTRLLFRYLTSIGTSLRGGYVRFWTQYISQLPIRTINLSAPADRAWHEQMVELVERMLDLHKRLAAAKTPPDRTALQRQIVATDRQIDRLVYELYGLTEEEIRIVEGKG